MANIVCYDSDGNLLNHYTQWDTDQKLIIKGVDTSSAPYFHFFNTFHNTSLVVSSTISGSSISADVPDVLLQDAIPLIVYVYYDEGMGSRTTEYSVRIPVIPRAKPSDYIYIEGGGTPSISVDVVDNLTTNSTTSALSASQGVVLKSLVDTLSNEKLDASLLSTTIEEALTLAKDSGDFIGPKGDPGPQGIQGEKGDIGPQGIQGESGRGIISVVRTSGNGAAGTTDTYTISYTDSTTSTFSVYNGANGINTSTGSDGSSGGSGENGATFIPYIDTDGNLSWSNDKGLANPNTVNIKGPKGDTGEAGTPGSNGADGISPSVTILEINGGYQISIIDATGTNSINVMNGVDPVKGTDYWTDSDKIEIVNDVLAALPIWNGGSY